MAFNAQLPNYFRQFDATGGQLLDGFMDQANPAMNPLAAQTQSEIASSGQSELSQLQSQISDLISGSAGQASAATLPASSAANPTAALTSTATLPAGLSTPATPGQVSTVSGVAADSGTGTGLIPLSNLGSQPGWEPLSNLSVDPAWKML